MLDLSCQSSALLATLVPQFQILDVPFLFKDANAGFRFLDGPVLRPVLDQLEAKGITVVGWGFNGFKEFQTVSKPVNVPDDMKGLRVRIQNSPGAVATYKAFGAIPVVIDISELFTAISQHTVDAIDQSIDAFVTFKYYNLAKYCAMLNHVFSVMPVMASKAKMSSLPANLQSLIRDEGNSLSQFWKADTIRRINDDIDVCKKNGVTFTNPPWRLRKAAEPAWPVFQQRIGGNLIEMAAKARSENESSSELAAQRTVWSRFQAVEPNSFDQV